MHELPVGGTMAHLDIDALSLETRFNASHQRVASGAGGLLV
jgi:hypothetical protein